MRKLVYKGDSGIGPVEIYEGDIVHFRSDYNVFSGYVAVFSPKHTLRFMAQGRVTILDKGLLLNSNWEDCTLVPQATHLIKVEPAGPKPQRLSGFGKFQRRLKDAYSV